MKKIIGCLVIALFCASCAGGKVENTYPKSAKDTREERGGKLTGEGGLIVLGGDKKRKNESGGSIGVNSYLWRAALDTLAFMPLLSADPFGGVIITDWYEDPKAPRERFKMNVYIIGGVLRADAVRVTVFKQGLRGDSWRSEDVKDALAKDIEDKILTRARQLKLSQSK